MQLACVTLLNNFFQLSVHVHVDHSIKPAPHQRFSDKRLDGHTVHLREIRTRLLLIYRAPRVIRTRLLLIYRAPREITTRLLLIYRVPREIACA